MPHKDMPTEEGQTITKLDKEKENPGLSAEIVRAELVDGNIRVRCPVDLAEMEVPVGQARVVCDIGGEQLIVKIENPANQTSHR